jgi:hypothetical protein
MALYIFGLKNCGRIAAQKKVQGKNRTRAGTIQNQSRNNTRTEQEQYKNKKRTIQEQNRNKIIWDNTAVIYWFPGAGTVTGG